MKQEDEVRLLIRSQNEWVYGKALQSELSPSGGKKSGGLLGALALRSSRELDPRCRRCLLASTIVAVSFVMLLTVSVLIVIATRLSSLHPSRMCIETSGLTSMLHNNTSVATAANVTVFCPHQASRSVAVQLHVVMNCWHDRLQDTVATKVLQFVPTILRCS
eukprot:TRINITY_DN33444_c0_g2_i1.p1 TRINITY_DN33444_c0_g2~~TRINITY_DN33444_c0_g2_i1.p1  ORF type:complete len:162 (-),score=22.25 TRINITY_DN33444_c0_g2_i1:257-742(-)